ncbi:hypothetical protein BKA70DRAFT_1204657 [Coprinopsis sp. MPI-PUGE-AT-0042]|nr:hypothetical protein BKA70DRAFT_1204657 [Coprinopsis sp. MPI-PUGE-AT-0042]
MTQETVTNDPQEQLPARLYWYDRSKKDWILPLTTPPPPRFDDPTSNHWVYGWGVSPAFYKQLLEQRWSRKAPEFPLKTGALVRARLKYAAGYRDLFTIYAKPDPQSESKGLVVLLSEDWGPGTHPAVQVLGFVCTASIRHYTRRPTVEQMEILCDLLGKPRWFECAESKKGFEAARLDGY